MTRPAMTPGAILGYTKRGTPIKVIAGAALDVETLPIEQEQFQSYLDELKDEQLEPLKTRLVERFQALRNSDNPDEETVQTMSGVGDQIKAADAEISKRRTTAAKQRAADTATAAREAMEALAADVLGDGASDSGSGGDDGNGDNDSASSTAVEQLATAISSAFEKATASLQPQLTAAASGTELNAHIRNHPSLGRVGQHTPDPKLAPTRSEAVLVASADIPGVAKNGRVDGIRQLVNLMGDRARMMSITRGKNINYVNVAKQVRDFRYKLNLDSTPEEINEVLTAATDVNALVAAGGWCAPSEISYDFFNIVCEDGLIDLPSVGVLNRGGFRFPTSPTIAEVFGGSNGPLWEWSEADDESAASDPGPTKPCARVTCPAFNDARLTCDGFCVTAGNLVDFAYPEMIENYLRIVMAARAHRTNQLIMTQLENASDAVDMTGSGEGSAASILNSVELQVVDYRERYRMCEDAVLETVFPRWAYAAIRADLANRTGVEFLSVTNAMIADWLNMRSVRAQFVADWQSGFTSEPFGDPNAIATSWPSSGDFLLYAPGNFVRGQGLQLDLGVVRDSTLNATNDHTAAWMEDCYAVAEVGHESRIVSTDISSSGVTGASITSS